MKERTLYAWMTAGGIIGMIAAFWQTLEKLTLIANESAQLNCNLNSVFSCSNVLNSWQASVFGFPNSIMCLVLFTIFTAVAIVGLSGGTISKGLRHGIQGLSLFTLGFALWFLGESTYVIHSICIFCIFCFAGLLTVNATWLRLNGGPIVRQLSKSGGDLFIWLLLGLLVGFAIALKFI